MEHDVNTCSVMCEEGRKGSHIKGRNGTCVKGRALDGTLVNM